MKRNAKVLFSGLFVLGAVSVCTLFGTTLTVSATNNVVSEEVLQVKSNEEVINEIIALAETKIGCRYTQSAEGRNGDDSFDCSGFVRYLYSEVTGVDIGTWTGHQEDVLELYQVPMSEIQPGDLLFGTGHVALYIGNGEIIHASNPKAYPEGGVKKGKVYDKLNRAYRPILFVNAK